MTKHIIIIDDDQELRKLLVLCLSLEGISALEATNGLEALELLEQMAPKDRPRLFIVDNLMPVMDGPQFVTELLKRQLVHSPEIVFYTGSLSMPEVTIAGKKMTVFAKPLDMDSIVQHIRKNLRSHDGMNAAWIN